MPLASPSDLPPGDIKIKTEGDCLVLQFATARVSIPIRHWPSVEQAIREVLNGKAQ